MSLGKGACKLLQEQAITRSWNVILKARFRNVLLCIIQHGNARSDKWVGSGKCYTGREDLSLKKIQTSCVES